MLLALALWLGGIVFFGAVMAPVLFTTLPSRAQAGAVVTRSLGALHWIGIVAAVVILVCTLAGNALAPQRSSAARAALVVGMLALTCISQFGVARRMETLRTKMGVIDDVPASDARRIAFNQLHQWSTRLEGGVLVLGVAALYLLSRD